MRLRGQYTLVIGGLVFASLLVLGAALLVEQERYADEIGSVAGANLAQTLEGQIEKDGIALASTLAGRLVSALYHRDIEQVLHEADEQREYPGVLSALVVDAGGRVIRDVETEGEIGEQHLFEPWVREAIETGRPVSEHQPGRLHVAAPAVVGRHVLGAVVLEISTDSIASETQVAIAHLHGMVRSQSTAFSLTGLGIGVMLVSLSILSAIGVAGGLSGPIEAFAARARRIGGGELVEAGGPARSDEIGDLARAFDEMAATLKKTTVSKDFFDNVLTSMVEMLVVTDAEGRIVSTNPSLLAELGCRQEELIGRPVRDFLPEAALGEGSAEPSRWFPLSRPAGGTVPVRVSAAPLRDRNGRPAGQVLVLTNVAERLAAQQLVERSLAEKEILLREIHHRVKNNLQIISSMLSLQAGRTDDEEAREVFHESEVRIRAMALVHEQLYRSGDLAHVDLQGYLGLLAQQVSRYYGRADCRVDVHVDDAVREVNVDQAIPIGLIVNELIANAIDHGLEGTSGGQVDVSLVATAEGRRLSVRDNGKGFPAGFDADDSDSLGLKLVQALAGQLGATLTLATDGGARCILELPPAPQDAPDNRTRSSNA